MIVDLREMRPIDLEDAEATEQLSFKHPFTQDEMEEILREKDVMGWVIEDAFTEELFGHLIIRQEERDLIIETLAVVPERRNQGIGTHVMGWIKNKLRPRGPMRILNYTWERNSDALRFLKKNGFLAIELVKAPYELLDDDCILMQFREHIENF